MECLPSVVLACKSERYSVGLHADGVFLMGFEL